MLGIFLQCGLVAAGFGPILVLDQWHNIMPRVVFSRPGKLRAELSFVHPLLALVLVHAPLLACSVELL